MWCLVHVAALLSSLAGVLAVGSVTQCNPDLTSQATSTGIIPLIQKNGQYSYVVVSSDETSFMGLKANCIGINMVDDHTAQVSYRLAEKVLGFIRTPTFKIKFPVTEEQGYIVQEDGEEYKLYVLYMSDAGVILTYRCCDTCTGTDPNVGIAVADNLKNSPDTKAALKAAQDKLHGLNLDSNVATVPYCS